MKKILHTVTVTGADDSVDPGDLLAIAYEYPFVEFGILLSNKASLGKGKTRFPSKLWLNGLCQAAKAHKHVVKCSGHLCGPWVEGFLTGYMIDLDSHVADGLGSIFRRFQLNTHAEPASHDVGLYENLCRLASRGKDVIFQLDGYCGTAIAGEVLMNGHKNIAGLFDLSHGAGKLPSQWPQTIDGLHCGYAGGLSPENVAAQLALIEQAAVGKTWIDAETHLYSPTTGAFDLNRVRAFLEAAKPWVI